MALYAATTNPLLLSPVWTSAAIATGVSLVPQSSTPVDHDSVAVALLLLS